MSGSTASVAPLLALAGAPSKAMVLELFNDSFECRRQGLSRPRRARLQADLQLPDADAAVTEIFNAAVWLIQSVLYAELNAEEAAELFPSDFHPDLRGLLVKVLTSQQASWREGSLQSQVGAPKYLDMDWRVGVKSASNFPGESGAEPVTHLKFRVQGEQAMKNEIPPHRELTVELDRTTLNTMYSTLSRIRDQLTETTDS